MYYHVCKQFPFRLLTYDCVRSLYVSPRILVFSRMYSSVVNEFNKAKEKLNTLPSNVENDVKLKIYGLFKQATVGPCTTSKPSSFDFVGKAKWNAWNSLGNLTKDEAMKQYIAVVNELMSSDSSSYEETTSEKGYDGISYVVEGNVTKITFCRPHKKNAITKQMYLDIPLALQKAGENETSLTVLTGEGDYFCSGNDLNNFASVEGDLNELAKKSADMLKAFVSSFIDFPKPLIAAVNGPAVGIAVTLLGLCDVVYASDKAFFSTPFSLLGQSPEACATYTFPKIMGYAKANEVLLFNKKLTASEAYERGLVTEVFLNSNFHEQVKRQVDTMAGTSKYSLMYSKQLIRDVERDTLHKVNAAECLRLAERWQSPDCMQAIFEFFQKKGKL